MDPWINEWLKDEIINECGIGLWAVLPLIDLVNNWAISIIYTQAAKLNIFYRFILKKTVLGSIYGVAVGQKHFMNLLFKDEVEVDGLYKINCNCY